MTQTVTALYDDYSSGLDAVRALEAAGIPHRDVSIVANNVVDRTIDAPSHAAEGAGAGAGIGAAVGGLGGLLAGLGVLAIPGVGPVVAAGWLIATAAGAATGAAVGGISGGIIGSLTRAGVDEREANVYAEGIRRGGTLVSARVPDAQLSAAREILYRYHPVDTKVREAYYRQEGWRSFDEHAPPYSATEIEAERERYR